MATLTDHIVPHLARPDVAASVPEQARQTWQTFERLLLQIGGALARVAQSPPSPGYEPWFVERGSAREPAVVTPLPDAEAPRSPPQAVSSA